MYTHPPFIAAQPGASCTNKVRSSGPPNKLGRLAPQENRTRKTQERWGRRRRWPPRAPTPFRGAWPWTPSMRTAAATAVCPPQIGSSLPSPFQMSERAKWGLTWLWGDRTVERGRLLCVVLCMLQLGLRQHNYCCAYLLSLSFSHLHMHSTDLCRWDL